MRGAVIAALTVASCTFESEPNVVRPTDCTGLADGADCRDENLCTTGERCVRGACVAAERVTCEVAGACRARGVCDPASGRCSDPVAPDGELCDDAELCTRADACFGGACRGIPVTCTATAACRTDGVCDPSTGACTRPLARDGTRCEDGDLCTAADTCLGGACLTGAPVDCEQSQCIVGVCDQITGVCGGVPIADGIPCDDLSVCTTGDTCLAGACVGDVLPCSTDDPCSTAACDAGLGCSIGPRPEGAACEDGNRCTEGEVCAEGLCGGGTAVTCIERDGCHYAGACDPTSGCSDPIRPDGTLCNDGTLCTFSDSCAQGVCSGIELICQATNACHLPGTCDPFTGLCSIVRLQEGATCDDGSECTRTDACSRGDCVGSDPIPWSGALCQDGVCFTDVALASGITWTSTDSGTTMIGAAAAFLDYDGDGNLDLMVGSESARPTLYRNLGTGAFQDVTVQAGLPLFFLPDRFMGFAAGDYDNDGDTDLYFLARGPNVLMRNDGDGTFTDVTQVAGVGDPSWSTAAAFGDYDGDGDLDLYVGNYIAVSNFPFHTAYPNLLYRNEGDGTFTEVGAQLGVAGAGTTLAVTWSDFDGDRDPDLFVCNDFGQTIEPNRLYRNDGGTFTESSALLGAAIQIYCMGIAPGDFDRDGDLDYYFTNIDRNVLLENRGALGFGDIARATGTEVEHDPCFTALYSTSWGAGFSDFDQDGFLDLYVSTGFIPAASHIANARATPKVLFKNDQLGGFTDVRQSSGVDDLRIGRGVAFGDYDGDGDVDLLQANFAGTPRLFQNVSPLPGARLGVEVTGRLSNRDAFGARAVAEIGGASLVRELSAGYSFASASEKTLRFGLGAAAVVDRLTIFYPSGVVQRLFEVPADMTVAVLEPYVFVEQMLSPPPASPGSAVGLSFTLRNVSSAAVAVDWTVRIGSQPGSSGAVTVPGNAAQSVSVILTAPGSSGSVPLFVTIGDAAGAIDQSRASLIVP